MASTSALHPLAPRPAATATATAGVAGSSHPPPPPSSSSSPSPPPRYRTNHTSLFRTLISSSPSSISGPSSPRSAFEARKRTSSSPVVGRTYPEAFSGIDGEDSQKSLTGQLALSELQKLGTKGSEREQGASKPTDERDRREREWNILRRADREWIAEAEKIYRHLSSLSAFLTQIRRPYLTTSGGASIVAAPPTSASSSQDDGRTSELSSLGRLAGLQRGLDDRERDEVDLKIKMALKRCRDRIRELEKGEEMRRQNTPTTSLSANPLLRLLQPALMQQGSVPSRAHPSYSAQLSSHRSSITSHLSSRLSSLSGRALAMQERLLEERKRRERMRRVLREPSSAALKGIQDVGAREKKSNVVKGVKGGMMDEDERGAVGGGGDALANLSSQEAQALELESSSLLQSLNEDLAAVQKAEAKIVEISELQAQLAQHLSEQREVSQRLEEEAYEHAEEVGKGNRQLEKARENSRLANRYLCLFLVGSGLGLLFLHWVD